MQHEGVLEHGAQQPLGEFVGELEGLLGGEVALHGVHHDVHAAARRLIPRQCDRELGVHDRELGAAVIGVAALLDAQLLVGDHAAVAHLGAGGCDGEHHADGRAARGLADARVEVPGIAAAGEAVADGLGGIDDRAAAHGEDEVHALGARELEALVDEREARVGHNAAQLDVGKARLVEGGTHAVDKSRAHSRLPAKMHEHLGGAELLGELARLALGTKTELDLRGRVIGEAVHRKSSSRAQDIHAFNSIKNARRSMSDARLFVQAVRYGD